MKNQFLLLFCFLSFSLGSCHYLAENPTFDMVVTVVRISDGDSFVGLTPDKKEVRMRIHGIDAPEKGQPFGKNSKQQLSDYIFRKDVYIHIKDTDRYGRKVVKVFTNDSTDVGLQMIKSGLAWHYTNYDNSKSYVQAEQRAKKQRLGLWNDSYPTAPWQWRKERRK